MVLDNFLDLVGIAALMVALLGILEMGYHWVTGKWWLV